MCLAPTRHADSGFAWHDSFANFFDFANDHRENRFASPAYRANLKRAVGGKEQAHVKGERRAKRPIIPRPSIPCWKIADDEIKAYVSRTFRASSSV